VALKFMWTLGNSCPQMCEVRVNSYVATEQYWRGTRYLLHCGRRVDRQDEKHWSCIIV